MEKRKQVKTDNGDFVWENCIIWLDEIERIASFHHVESYQAHEFDSNDHYLQFLNGLLEGGYRFQ